MDGVERSLLQVLDFSPIESEDPSLKPDFKTLYRRECPFEIRFQETQAAEEEIGSLEAINVKLLVMVIFESLIWLSCT